MSTFDKLFHTPETQATITTGAGLTYYMTQTDWIAALTIALLVGQLGLLAVKYIHVYKEWKARKKANLKVQTDHIMNMDGKTGEPKK
jgi:hypothetical protein